jgi:hypothetical protein
MAPADRPCHGVSGPNMLPSAAMMKSHPNRPRSLSGAGVRMSTMLIISIVLAFEVLAIADLGLCNNL